MAIVTVTRSNTICESVNVQVPAGLTEQEANEWALTHISEADEVNWKDDDVSYEPGEPFVSSYDSEVKTQDQAQPHIKDQITALLKDQGWNTWEGEGRYFSKRIEKFAEAGTISDGTRVITLHVDETGRWLSSLDCWDKPDTGIDLRDYWNSPVDGPYTSEPQKAINDLLELKRKAC